LLANELFGHEKGAYTGADTVKKGLLEVAEGGTLFLDEITEMSSVRQVKLLRTVQEREIMRVGGTQSRAINVRFITATNLNLQQEVNNGNFRRDLFFRINVIMIHLPSLVERKDDIPLLIQYFLKKYATWIKKGVTEISPEALELLMKYDFPGNVRELENIIERGVALAQGDTIDIEHLAEEIRSLTLKTYRRKEDGSVPSLAEQERSYIQWVLNEAGGNKSLAAQQLGIDRVSLWRKLKKGNTAPSE
jgi:transcriptional regulator with PAS, ATPase and Fis domain